jgi:hypothetical protein
MLIWIYKRIGLVKLTYYSFLFSWPSLRWLKLIFVRRIIICIYKRFDSYFLEIFGFRLHVIIFFHRRWSKSRCCIYFLLIFINRRFLLHAFVIIKSTTLLLCLFFLYLFKIVNLMRMTHFTQNNSIRGINDIFSNIIFFFLIKHKSITWDDRISTFSTLLQPLNFFSKQNIIF